ncbi:hypothetical protein [Nocardioides sp. URHA0032]|uniref:hypothetical protein n=1 Tax=Nocardioides sp. URHA0032 TaxID=1380388 RepID=UPI00048FE31F|nr:hypothetical protein [Nocardioides sp. URHA0032]
MSRTRLGALVASLALVLASLGVGPTYAGSRTAKERAVQQQSRIVVKWQGYQKRPRYQKTADVPGIGQVDLVCQPNNTMIRLHANDRRAETQMWMAKFETKDGSDRVAVKNVRIFTYATAADDGKGGTGSQAHEGLNQRTPIEDYEKGSAYGVISQRPGRNQPGGGTLALPATSFKLTWYWERFAFPGSQYCKMTLALNTDTDQQFGLSWHGDDEAARQTTSATTLPGFGEARLRCETGRYGEQTVALQTNDPDSYMDYEYVRGEGQVGEHVDHYSDLAWDPVTGLLGPVDLPTNGMMRIWWSVGGVKKLWVLSSYMVTNNDVKPWLNVCEVAAAPVS